MPLDPTVPSFPFPSARRHSPTISSASNTSNTATASSYLTSSAINTPPSRDSPEPIHTDNVNVNVIKRKKAVSFHPGGDKGLSTTTSFGKGWMSTILTPPAEHEGRLRVDCPVRTRSPSVPNLPSQMARGQGADQLAAGFGQLGLSQADFNKYYSPAPTLHHQPSISSFGHPHTPLLSPSQYNPGLFADQISQPSQHSLSHHQSVPNLPHEYGTGWSTQHGIIQEHEESGLVRAAAGLGKRSRSLSSVAGTGQRRNVWIPNIVATWTEEYVKDLASDYGHVLSVKIGHRDIRDGSTVEHPIPAQFCRSHAFVLFQQPEEAAEFILAVKANGAHCEYAKEDFQTEWKSREDPNSSNLYVQGLCLDDTEEAIARLFAPFGRIVTMKILVDDQGRRRGPVLARMQSRPQAEDAIKQLNGRYYARSGEKLQVRVADSDQQKDLKKRASYQGKSALVTPGQQLWSNDFEPVEDHRSLHYRAFLEEELRKVESTLGPRVRTPSYTQVHMPSPALDRRTSQPRMFPTPSHGIAPSTTFPGPSHSVSSSRDLPASQSHLLSSLHYARSSPELGNHRRF
ncbi:hypothetical protein BCR39DRAFT_558672 [Naematelia encephala]|uniref:RRM domain-containing protein n=1 Tax=Naematelia encephala TaxID=71784 RepID=A0A1Y2B6D0_9TREE|nr:hypothetical protein BCR39DRAFT_558672 [Naematelia encephala]